MRLNSAPGPTSGQSRPSQPNDIGASVPPRRTLKKVVESSEIDVIGQARARPAGFLDAEEEFQAYVFREAQVLDAAQAEAALAARANAERLDGFIKEYIARNIAKRRRLFCVRPKGQSGFVPTPQPRKREGSNETARYSKAAR